MTSEPAGSVIQASTKPIRRKSTCAMVMVVLAMTTEGTLSS